MPIMTGVDDAGLPRPIRATEKRQAKTADADVADLLKEILAELRTIRELAENLIEEL